MAPDREKLTDLSQRIHDAEAKTERGILDQPLSPGTGRMGYDFAGIVIGSGLLGSILDYVFNTMPWFMLGMVFVGFAFGILNAWRAMQKSDTENN